MDYRELFLVNSDLERIISDTASAQAKRMDAHLEVAITKSMERTEHVRFMMRFRAEQLNHLSRLEIRGSERQGMCPRYGHGPFLTYLATGNVMAPKGQAITQCLACHAWWPDNPQ